MELNLSVLDQYDLKTCNVDFQIFNEEDFKQVRSYFTNRLVGEQRGVVCSFTSSPIRWFSIYHGNLCVIGGYNGIIIDLYSPGPLIKKPNLKKVWI